MIEKYLDAFPYGSTYFPKSQEICFFLKDMPDDKKVLHLLDLSQSTDLSDGRAICNEDFSKRSYLPIDYNPKNQQLYIRSDDSNRENFNIYTIDIKSGNLSKVTDCTYCSIYGISEDFNTLIYGDRYKSENGIYHTWIYQKDLQTQEIRPILEDEGWEYRLSWSGVCFVPSQNGIVLEVDWKNRRRKRNLLFIDLGTKEFHKLLPEDKEAAWVSPLNKLSHSGEIYYSSDLEGFENLYHVNLNDPKKEVTQLTNYELETNGSYFDDENQTGYLLLSDYRNDQTILNKVLLNENHSPKISDAKLRGTHQLTQGEGLWIYSSNMDQPPVLTHYDFSSSLRKLQSINLFRGAEESLSHNSYRYVEFESFDGKMVPAYLSIPKGPIRGAVITAFYGGVNTYYWPSQLFAEMGLAELSPAVRGSWTHGSEWRDQIKGDLGGNEILDLHWGARFLESELGLKPDQIGLEGGSHGGYSVLRGLTIPEGFHPQAPSSYPYGFGICWAGFADLEDFYHTSNIPDWLVDMLGPYEGNEQKYRERSPVHHFDNLNSSLFISHGTNDPRVSPSSMQGFLTKLEASDKDYIVHKMDGLGHAAGGREEKLQLYRKMLEFLGRVIDTQ